MNEATKIIDNEEIFDRILITIINQKQIKINRFRKYNYNYNFQSNMLLTNIFLSSILYATKLIGNIPCDGYKILAKKRKLKRE